MVRKSSSNLDMTDTNFGDENDESNFPDESVIENSSPRTGEKNKVTSIFKNRKAESATGEFEANSETDEATNHTPDILGQAQYASTDFSSKQQGIEFMEIMKMHFLNPILDDLDKVQLHANSDNAAVYINRVLHTIRQMEDRSPNDPFFDLLSALYDALAFNNNWANYTGPQYAKAKEILKRYSERVALDQKAIEKAINELEDIGFDTTPFDFNLETFQ